MIFKAVLSNKAHPEYGAATIPFPIPDGQYDSTINLLDGIGIGAAVAQDCRVEEVPIGMPVLNRLVAQSVNVDELDYLAKRLGSFDQGEGIQFQAMASVLSLSNIKDLINLTFCCQQATVITNFSDLDRIGKHHYLNLGNGSMPLEKFEALDGQSIALDLIQSGAGMVTPYGVAYDNGMKLEPVYDGRHLPKYYYEPCVAAVTLTHAGEREILYLPCADSKISRTIQRLGAEGSDECEAAMDSNEICDAVLELFEKEFRLNEHLDALNRLARCYQGFKNGQMEKFHTVFDTTWPQTPEETVCLAENLRDFIVVPDIGSPEEYGQHIAKEMDVDAEVLESLDFHQLGQRRINAEGGVFGDRGYVAYRGVVPLAELLRTTPPEQHQQEQGMGGMM